MNWLERWQKLERKNRRATIKRNVRAYRKRQAKAGIRRIEIALAPERYLLLRQIARAEETYSDTVGRLLEAISGNREQKINGQ